MVIPDWQTSERNFVARVAREREARGWSQRELARRITEAGIAWHQPTVQRVESGERPVRVNEAVLLCKLLDLDLLEAVEDAADLEAQAVRHLNRELARARHLWDDLRRALARFLAQEDELRGAARAAEDAGAAQAAEVANRHGDLFESQHDAVEKLQMDLWASEMYAEDGQTALFVGSVDDPAAMSTLQRLAGDESASAVEEAGERRGER